MNVRSHKAAQAAFERVEQRKSQDNSANYRSIALDLPSMIMQYGLAQATGFLLAKGKSEHRELLDDLASVMREAGDKDCKSGTDLHQRIIHSDVIRTMLLTRRSLEASAWIKRYVQAMMKPENSI